MWFGQPYVCVITAATAAISSACEMLVGHTAAISSACEMLVGHTHAS
jgi:ribonuclease PH